MLVNKIARIAASCLFAALLFASGAHAQNVRTIFFVRHADKVSDDTDALLSDAGHRRAECLARMLADAHIQRIYTSELQRTLQTAAPLADQLHLLPLAIPLSTPDKLIEALRSDKSANILVVWHDATLPKILQALGAPAIPPIAHTEYDRLFILTFQSDRKGSKPGLTVLRYCD